ncbi:NADPH-dependent FMN reductase [Streptomyces sp. NPDC051051]|uniref:NADPH-dependent FMN reductase n=1 Tax=Streptomyces sp. NPDC051051 TaxID=3155666 RepID=UPI003434E3B1
MATVLALSGSPSPTSRTTCLIERTATDLRAHGHHTRTLALRELPAAPLLAADTKDPAIARAVRLVAEADALVIGTPLYKAAYSGLLKTFLDLLPQHALTGRPVLPLATGGTPAHVLAIDYALRPVLTSLGAQVAQGWFVWDQHVATAPDGTTTLDAATGHALDRITGQFAEHLAPSTLAAA